MESLYLFHYIPCSLRMISSKVHHIKHLMDFPLFKAEYYSILDCILSSVHPGMKPTCLTLGNVCCEHRWQIALRVLAHSADLFFFAHLPAPQIGVPTWVRAFSGHALPMYQLQSHSFTDKVGLPMPPCLLEWKNCRITSTPSLAFLGGVGPQCPPCWLVDVQFLRWPPSWLNSHSPTLASWDTSPGKCDQIFT